MVSILLVEPYDTGSHAAWMRGYQRHSQHKVDILSLPGKYWQWRMHGGAVTLARLYMDSDLEPDLIVASDMLDLTTFLALTRSRTAQTRTAVYFHENQLTYPPGPRIKRDLRLGFVNYASALVADHVFFNSDFHRYDFLDELPRMLKHYPDYNELPTIDAIKAKSQVLPLGLELHRFDMYGPKPPTDIPIILWNHRWDYDKNPETFFNTLYALKDHGCEFRVIIVGENQRQKAVEFETARERLGSRILHYGYVDTFSDYARLLWQATHVVSCAYQDFFGISVCEAIYCGCFPLMPRRLNYPDLIPTDMHPLCLYEDDNLTPALELALTKIAPPSLHQTVNRFDWSLISRQYDQVLDTAIKGSG